MKKSIVSLILVLSTISPLLSMQQQAEEYDRNSDAQDTLAQQDLKQFSIDKTNDVLVPGCRTGRMCKRLAEHYASQGTVVGMDTNPYMLDVARKKHHTETTTYELTQDQKAPVKFQKRFDRVVSIHDLHWVKTEQQIAVMQSYQQSLRPGGTLLLSMASKTDKPHPVFIALGQVVQQQQEWRELLQGAQLQDEHSPQTEEGLKELAATSGFNITNIESRRDEPTFTRQELNPFLMTLVSKYPALKTLLETDPPKLERLVDAVADVYVKDPSVKKPDGKFGYYTDRLVLVAQKPETK